MDLLYESTVMKDLFINDLKPSSNRLILTERLKSLSIELESANEKIASLTKQARKREIIPRYLSKLLGTDAPFEMHKDEGADKMDPAADLIVMRDNNRHKNNMELARLQAHVPESEALLRLALDRASVAENNLRISEGRLKAAYNRVSECAAEVNRLGYAHNTLNQQNLGLQQKTLENQVRADQAHANEVLKQEQCQADLAESRNAANTQQTQHETAVKHLRVAEEKLIQQHQQDLRFAHEIVEEARQSVSNLTNELAVAKDGAEKARISAELNASQKLVQAQVECIKDLDVQLRDSKARCDDKKSQTSAELLQAQLIADTCKDKLAISDAALNQSKNEITKIQSKVAALRVELERKNKLIQGHEEYKTTNTELASKEQNQHTTILREVVEKAQAECETQQKELLGRGKNELDRVKKELKEQHRADLITANEQLVQIKQDFAALNEELKSKKEALLVCEDKSLDINRLFAEYRTTSKTQLDQGQEELNQIKQEMLAEQKQAASALIDLKSAHQEDIDYLWVNMNQKSESACKEEIRQKEVEHKKQIEETEKKTFQVLEDADAYCLDEIQNILTKQNNLDKIPPSTAEGYSIVVNPTMGMAVKEQRNADLIKYQSIVSEAESQTDDDFFAFSNSWRSQLKKWKTPGPTGGISIIALANIALHNEILSQIVNKASGIRMVVRFNNGPYYKRTHHNSIYLQQGKGGAVQGLGESFFCNSNSTKTNWRGYNVDDSKPYTKIIAHKTAVGSNIVAVEETFTFEKVYTDSSQEDVFLSLKPFIFTALQGQALGVMCYGGSGSGKTHSMIGNILSEKDCGIMPRVLDMLMNCKEINTVDVQIVEINPGISENGELVHRMYDLVDIAQKNTFDIKIHKPKKEATFFTLTEDKKDGMKSVLVECPLSKASFEALTGIKGGLPAFYNAVDGTKTCDQRKLKEHEVDLKEPQKAFASLKAKQQPDEKIDRKTLLVTLSKVMSQRRVEKTDLNPQSSRSHMVITLKFTKSDNITNYLYLMDFAGKEDFNPDHLAGKNDKLKSDAQLSKGINISLKSLVSAIQLKKREIPINVGELAKANPLFMLTAPLWSQPKSKIMMVACVYPFYQKEIHNAFVPNWSIYFGKDAKIDSKHFDSKFKRDIEILRELSNVQALATPLNGTRM
jgi:hypothetical protein